MCGRGCAQPAVQWTLGSSGQLWESDPAAGNTNPRSGETTFICPLIFAFFPSFFFKFDVMWLRLRLSLSALGQVDRRRRKHRYPLFQSPDGDARGKRLGESHCQQ